MPDEPLAKRRGRRPRRTELVEVSGSGTFQIPGQFERRTIPLRGVSVPPGTYVRIRQGKRGKVGKQRVVGGTLTEAK